MDKIEKFERLSDSSAEFETDKEAETEFNRLQEISDQVKKGILKPVPVKDANGNEVGMSYVDEHNKIIYFQAHNIEEEYRKRLGQNSKEN